MVEKHRTEAFSQVADPPYFSSNRCWHDEGIFPERARLELAPLRPTTGLGIFKSTCCISSLFLALLALAGP